MKKYVAYVAACILLFSLLTGGVLHFRSDACLFANERFDADSQMSFAFSQKRHDVGIPFLCVFRRVSNSNKATVTFLDFKEDRYRRILIESIDVSNSDNQTIRINQEPLGGALVTGSAIPGDGHRGISSSFPVDVDRLERVVDVTINGWVEDKGGSRRDFSLTFAASRDSVSEVGFLWWLLP